MVAVGAVQVIFFVNECRIKEERVRHEVFAVQLTGQTWIRFNLNVVWPPNTEKQVFITFVYSQLKY